MKIDWLVADVTAVRSLDRPERAFLGVIVTGRVLANSDHVCGRGAILCVFDRFGTHLWLLSHFVM